MTDPRPNHRPSPSPLPSSAFRTVELSPNLGGEVGCLRMVTVKSTALRARADLTLWSPSLPADAPAPAHCAILLHGVYGSHWAWALKGNAHRTAQAMIDAGEIAPMHLIMPSDGLRGDGSAYLPHPGYDTDAWIADDLITLSQELLSLPEKTAWHLGGLSMGGYGALRIGAKYPERFASISGHSSITKLADMAAFIEEPLDQFAVASQNNPDESDILYWMEKNRTSLPRLRFDCGREDTLIESNRQLHADLDALSIPHVYEEFSGEHSWDFWEEHLRDSLRFFAGTNAEARL